MLEAYIEWLDQIYWKGYAQDFQDDNPDAFYSQLTAFTENYQISK